MPTPAEELPEVDDFCPIGNELVAFRREWGPQNRAMGARKWESALEMVNRMDQAIDTLKGSALPHEVEEAQAAALEEIQLALSNGVPGRWRDELKMYAEMYTPEE